MNFPKIDTDLVFQRIPKNSPEAMVDFMWTDALFNLGNCDIELKSKIGIGHPDILLRYYDKLGDKYIWMLGEYKKDIKQESNAIAQLLMYLGNFFYDTNIEGVDNLGGIFIASGNHFRLIQPRKVFGIMDKFEYIWRKHFRIRPCDAYEELEIREFIKENSPELLEDSLLIKRYVNKARLDEIIKSIYKEWNLL